MGNEAWKKMNSMEIRPKEGKVFISQHSQKVAQQWLDYWNMLTAILLVVYSKETDSFYRRHYISQL